MNHPVLRAGLLCGLLAALPSSVSASPVCTSTGFFRDYIEMTAALINPAYATGEVDATGCNIGVFFSDGVTGLVEGADIHGANYFGVLVLSTMTRTSVDVLTSRIHDIGESPLNGAQHGIAVYYRSETGGAAVGRVSRNTITNYQKGGIVANFTGTQVSISDNIVAGLGPIAFIAQNGIQIGWGASASVMRNLVSGHSYTGTSTVSGGIIAVGGAYYGEALTVNTRIEGNTVVNNDVGVFLTNLADGNLAPATATNIKVVNNRISSGSLTNNYGGFGYQAGVADVGNNDKIINNTISGAGYDPAANPSAYTVRIDADVSFTNRPKVHANK